MRITGVVFFVVGLVLPLVLANDYFMHPSGNFATVKKIEKRSVVSGVKNEELSAGYWLKNGQEAVEKKLALKVNKNIAKNTILFLGDGMSIPTISATRVYIGGEEAHLAFDTFPYSGLSKTYCVDNQVADSACSATAYLGGVKANLGTIGVTASVQRNDCAAASNASNFVYSLANRAQLAHKRTGLVTTARVTHASPAGVYAHTAQRDWESDSDVAHSHHSPAQCHDIAHQLIHSSTGSQLNVIFGGGRSNFLPKQPTGLGNRSDNRNLITEYFQSKKKKSQKAAYVSNREELLNLSPSNTDYVLGLFNNDHMSFNLQRNKSLEPSLAEMTLAAIQLLENSNSGFFLFVEGARIDMAHHGAQARMALDETSEFSRAVQAAVEATSESDTLIVVTSDHAHTMSYSGYAGRGQDILGVAGEGTDHLPYTILNYANGPGYRAAGRDGARYDVSRDNMLDSEFRYPGLVPMRMETHGGDDVAVFARGPWAHLFSGVMEQNVIPQLVSFAMCLEQSELGRVGTACDFSKETEEK